MAIFKRNVIMASDGQVFDTAAPPAAADGREFDFTRIKQIIRRNRWIAVGCIAFAVLAAILVTMATTPTFQATASVQLEQQSARILEVDEVAGEANPSDAERFLQTQIDLLLSRSLAIRVAERLGFLQSDEFLITMGEDPSGIEGPPAVRKARLRDAVISTLQNNLAVSLPRNSRVASITFYSPNSALAARVANAYAEALIADNLQRRYKASTYAREFLEDELAETKARLEDSERAAITYARSAGLIDTGPAGSGENGERARSLVTSSMVSMNDTLSEVAAERLRAQQRWERVAGTPATSLPEVLNNNAVQQLYERRAELQADLEKQLETRLPDYPPVRQVRAQIEEIDRQIGTLAASIKSSIRQAYQVAARQESAIESRLNQLRSSTLAEQGRSIQYNILRREVETNRELYDGLLQRYKEVGAAAGVTANNISIVDTADEQLAPTWPKPFLNLALALVLGAIAAGVIAFAREMLDDAIRSPEDVEAKLGVMLLGTAPKLTAGQEPLDELENQRSPLAEAYASLRVSIGFAGEGGIPKSMLITSSQASEGKSTSSYAIARSLTQVGLRVLLVDGDLRKPSLHRLLGTAHDNGFSNVLSQAGIKPPIVATGVDKLDFLPSGPLPPNPADLYARPQAREAFQRLIGDYDHVVIDGPPVLGLADAPLLADLVEGTIFLVDVSKSHRGRVRAAIRRLQRANAKLLGVVLTKFDAVATGYGDYGYSYEYGDAAKTRRAQPIRRLIGDRF